jgi:hypothetical protein
MEADEEEVEVVIGNWGGLKTRDDGQEMLTLGTTELALEAMEQVVETA